MFGTQTPYNRANISMSLVSCCMHGIQLIGLSEGTVCSSLLMISVTYSEGSWHKYIENPATRVQTPWSRRPHRGATSVSNLSFELLGLKFHSCKARPFKCLAHWISSFSWVQEFHVDAHFNPGNQSSRLTSGSLPENGSMIVVFPVQVLGAGHTEASIFQRTRHVTKSPFKIDDVLQSGVSMLALRF